jgi:hypothetical protein
MNLPMIPLAIVALSFSATIASASCPDYGQNGASYSFSSNDLYSERRLSVAAGGEIDLSTCQDAPGIGYVAEAPDFTIQYERSGSYDLRIRSQGSCDTVLLVNDASGSWYWDDESGHGPDTQVVLNTPSSGYIDIWVGTYNDEICDATLLLETFER